VETAEIHLNSPQHICPVCKKRYRECGCDYEVIKSKIGDPPHQSRPWGYKGVMRLPEDHPDHPKNL
jgi:hypothetical protein